MRPLALDGLRDAPAGDASTVDAKFLQRRRGGARRSRRRRCATALGPYARRGRSAAARVARGAHPFVRDVTVSNSTFGNRYVQLAAPHLGVHALGGGIGQGMAMAIGAALARRRRRRPRARSATAARMVNLGELATAVEEKADIVFVLMNDRGYGVIRNIQDAQYGGRRHYADLHTPDFGLLAAAFGTAASAGVAHRGVRDGARSALGDERAATGGGRHGRNRPIRGILCRAAGRRRQQRVTRA